MAMTAFFDMSAWDIWQKCQYDRVAQKNFWADVVSYARTNPDKASFWEQLIKASDGNAKNQNRTPLPVIVKRLVKASHSFDRLLWNQVIAEWVKIKDELKLDLEKAIRQNPDLIKNFAIATLTDASKPAVFQAACGGGLPKHYHKSDIALMFCSILADRLLSEDGRREIERIMNEGVFQIAEETSVTAPPEEKQLESVVAVQPVPESAVHLLWEDFLADFAKLDPMENDCANTEPYLTRLTQLVEQKNKERLVVLRRRELSASFLGRIRGISRDFARLLREFKLDLALSPDNLKIENLEAGLAALDGLAQAFVRYNDLSAVRSGSLTEEKKRLGLLYTTTSDIENLMKILDQAVRIHQPPQEKPCLSSLVTLTERRSLLSDQDDGDYEEETESADGQMDLFIRPDEA